MDLTFLNISSIGDLLTVGGLTVFVTGIVQLFKKVFKLNNPLIINLMNLGFSILTIVSVLTYTHQWTDVNVVIQAFVNALIVAGGSSLLYETVNSVSKISKEGDRL